MILHPPVRLLQRLFIQAEHTNGIYHSAEWRWSGVQSLMLETRSPVGEPLNDLDETMPLRLFL